MTSAGPDPATPETKVRALSSGQRAWISLAVFVLAFALRAAYVFQVWSHPAARLPILDADAYRRIALEIRAGDWLGDAVYYLDPLYPFFLAGIYSVIEPDTRGVLLVQAFLDSVSVVITMLIARRLFGDRSAIVAGLLAATYEVYFYYDGLLQKEALMIFLLTSALLLILRAADQERARAWLPAGFLVGMVALTRGNSLLFAPVMLLWILIAGRGDRFARLAATLLFGVGIAAAILPVTVRNYRVGGDFVLLNSQAGQNFYIGNFRANQTGGYLTPPFLRPNPRVEETDFAAEARRRTGRSDLRPSEVSNYWFRQGLAEIAADPGQFVRHAVRKTLLIFNRYEIPDNQSFEYYQRNFAPMLGLPFPTWAAVVPFAASGIWFARRLRLTPILVLFLASYASGLVMFFNLSRMRLPLVPVAIVFASFALVQFAERLRRRDLRGLVVPAAIASAIVPITRLDLLHFDLSVRHYNIGWIYVERGEEHWQKGLALRARGDEAGARAELERALEERSRAEEEYERGIERYPDSELLRNVILNSMLARAAALGEIDRPEAALEVAQAIATRFAQFPASFVALGKAYEGVGKPALAANAFRRALDLEPGNREAAEGYARTRNDAGVREERGRL